MVAPPTNLPSDAEHDARPSTPLVHTSLNDGVFTITLDSPHNRNALSTRLISELAEAMEAARVARPRTLVLDHTGPAFCAGADLKERAASNAPMDPAPMIDVMNGLMDVPFVTIAAVRGPARAGGLGLVAACDLAVVAAPVTFALTEVRIGVAAAIVSVPILRRVGPSVMRAAFLTGSQFSASEAERWGLVSHVCDADEIDATLAELCEAVQAGSPAAVAATKRLIDDVPRLGRAEAFAQMGQLSSALFAGPDAATGIAAFESGQRPTWPIESPRS